MQHIDVPAPVIKAEEGIFWTQGWKDSVYLGHKSRTYLGGMMCGGGTAEKAKDAYIRQLATVGHVPDTVEVFHPEHGGRALPVLTWRRNPEG